MTRSAIVTLSLCGLLVANTAPAQEVAPPEITRLEVGFNGQCKVGVWTPVRVTLRGGNQSMSGRVSITTADGDGTPSRVWTPVERPCSIRPNHDTSILMYVRFGRIKCELTVKYHVDNKVACRRIFQTKDKNGPGYFTPPISATRTMILVIGSDPVGVEEAIRLQRQPKDREPLAARVKDVTKMPTAWYGYEGVDTLVLSTSKPEIYKKLSPQSDRIQALEKWIRLGGKLVLSVGREAETVLKPGAPLAQFAPGILERVVPLRQTGPLESYSRGQTAVPQSTAVRTGIPAANLTSVRGKVDLSEATLPLVIRTPYSFGQIVFAAIDLDQPPLAGWSDRGLLVARLLDMPTKPSEKLKKSSIVMHVAYNDMTGQLRSALDRFTDVRLVPFWLVAVLVIGFVMLIGPVDYLLLRKLGRRMTLTWITFPTIVIIVSAATYVASYHLKGNEIRINQVNLIDIDTTSGQLRGTSWANFFSPKVNRYDLSFEPFLPNDNTGNRPASIIAWLGLPGTTLGAMNPQMIDSTMWNRPYDFASNLDAMLGLPVQMWSTKNLVCRWDAKIKRHLNVDLTREDQLPVGTVTNTFDFPLEECLLVIDRWVYQLGTIQPGESAQITLLTRRSELRTLLTGRKMFFDQTEDKYLQISTPYDRSSTDVKYIIRMMTFFESVGGRRYTSQYNEYQQFTDMSQLLDINRALLFAQTSKTKTLKNQGGANLICNKEPITGPENRRATIYRFVLPIK